MASDVRKDIMSAAKAVSADNMHPNTHLPPKGKGKKMLLTGKGHSKATTGKAMLKGGKPTPGGIGGKPSVGKKHGL